MGAGDTKLQEFAYSFKIPIFCKVGIDDNQSWMTALPSVVELHYSGHRVPTVRPLGSTVLEPSTSGWVALPTPPPQRTLTVKGRQRRSSRVNEHGQVRERIRERGRGREGVEKRKKRGNKKGIWLL